MNFELGAVLRRTFGALGRNFVTFFILSLILTGLPQVILLSIIGNPLAGDAAARVMSPGYYLTGLVSVVTTYILQGALIKGSIADFGGGKASMGDCISTGLRHFLPLIAIAILSAIGMSIGFMLLFVPGVILMVMWSVAVPVRVAEGQGIISSFGRSRALTKGSRWKIFGLLIIYGLLAAAINLGISLLIAFAPGSTVLGMIVQLVISAITGMIGAVGVAALYFELRRIKEGINASELLAVFD